MFTTDPLLPEVYKTNLISTIVDLFIVYVSKEPIRLI